MQSVRAVVRTARPMSGCAVITLSRYSRPISNSSRLFEASKHTSPKPVQAAASRLGGGGLAAAIGTALLVGYGIAEYNTGSSSPIAILDFSRIPTSKYAELKDMENVRCPESHGCKIMADTSTPRPSTRSAVNSATRRTSSPQTPTIYSPTASRNGPRSMSTHCRSRLLTPGPRRTSAPSPAYATSGRSPSFPSAAAAVSRGTSQRRLGA